MREAAAAEEFNRLYPVMCRQDVSALAQDHRSTYYQIEPFISLLNCYEDTANQTTPEFRDPT